MAAFVPPLVHRNGGYSLLAAEGQGRCPWTPQRTGRPFDPVRLGHQPSKVILASAMDRLRESPDAGSR
jgi:hypothetical protein